MQTLLGVVVAVSLLGVYGYLSSFFFQGDLTSSFASSGTTNIVLDAPSAILVNTVYIEDSLPTLSVNAGTTCSLGVALVKGLGFTPSMQLIYGQPLIVPEEAVIASKVWQFTSLDYDVQTKTPFIYDSLLDPTWTPIHLNQGDTLILMTMLNCDGTATVVYGGQITWT